MSRPGLRLRARQLRVRVERKIARLLGYDRTVYVDQRVDEYRRYWAAAAHLIGARFEPVTNSVWKVELNGCEGRVSGHVVSLDDPVTLRLAGDKPYCHTLARSLNLPTPEHLIVSYDGIDQVRDIIGSDPGPWVIKPAASSSSALGVTTTITRVQQVAKAVALATLYSDRIMLERMIPGESCRLLFLDGKLLSAVRRRGTRVMADGRSTTRQIAISTGLGRVLRDPIFLPTLASQGLDPDTIPPQGRTILLRGTGAVDHRTTELRTIYDETITSRVHPDTVTRLASLVKGLGSRFAGVDIVTVDPAVPLEQNKGAFLEVNTTPGIHHHYQSADDHHSHPVAVAVLQALLDADVETITATRIAQRKGIRHAVH